jgi:hypothetical protein
MASDCALWLGQASPAAVLCVVVKFQSPRVLKSSFDIHLVVSGRAPRFKEIDVVRIARPPGRPAFNWTALHRAVALFSECCEALKNACFRSVFHQVT